MLLIVVGQPSVQAFLERFGTSEITPFQESPTQYAEKQFHLIEPRTVNRCEMEHMPVTGVAQEGTALLAGPQGFEVAR